MTFISSAALSLNNSSGLHRNRLEFEGLEDCSSVKLAARAPQTFASRCIGRLSPKWAATRLQSGKVIHINIRSACKRLNLERRDVIALCDRNELESYVADHKSTLRKVDSLLPHLAERTMDNAYEASTKLANDLSSFFAPQWVSSNAAFNEFGLLMNDDTRMFWHRGHAYFIKRDLFDRGSFKEAYRTQPINSDYREELVSLRGKAETIESLIAVQAEHKFLQKLQHYDCFPKLFHYSFDNGEFHFIEKS